MFIGDQIPQNRTLGLPAQNEDIRAIYDVVQDAWNGSGGTITDVAGVRNSPTGFLVGEQQPPTAAGVSDPKEVAPATGDV